MGSHLPGQGARISKVLPENNKKIPLLQCFLKVRKWFENERLHNTEVRQKHLVQRLKYQMEYEKDRQIVLQQQGSPLFKNWYLAALDYRLARFQIHNQTNEQITWFETKAAPRMGATARGSQRKSENSTRNDEQKFQLTAQGLDYAIDLVARGTAEELVLHVADPESFIANRKQTKFVVLDETALWLKCRGEELVYQCALEIERASKRRQVRRAAKRLENREAKEEIESDFREWCSQNIENPDDREILCQWYHSGGDKHRLTLVNISQVDNWWDPDLPVEWGKDVLVFLVFAAEHVRADDIDNDHRFNKTVTVETSDGPVTHEKGEFTRLLWPYIEWRKTNENDIKYKKLHIFGQPRAWVDTQVNIWLADLLHEVYGQAVLASDCLLSRWSQHSLLAFWSNQIMLVPYAPEAGTLMQEPDTHEHGQMKADIRHVKGEIQFDLESEAKNKGKTGKIKWGPFEYMEVLSRGMERFETRNPLVPIQGLIQDHVLAVRPTYDEDGQLQIKLLEECSENSTKELLNKAGIDRYPAYKGLSDNWCRVRDAKVHSWPLNRPPKPDWDQYAEAAILVQDDLPAQPGADDVVLDLDDFQDLDLSDHQKMMLLPVETRISDIVYPASVQARVQTMNTTGKLRKQVWNNKFKNLFAGKLTSKWKLKVSKAMGIKQSAEELSKKLGPAVTIKKKAKPKCKPGPQKGATYKKDKPATVSQLKTEEKVENHPDLKKLVTVTDEAAGETFQGRRGTVTSVFEVREANGTEWVKYMIMEDSTKANQFPINSSFCQESSTVGKTVPLGQAVDWRVLRGSKLESVINLLGARTHPANLEQVVPGVMVEHSTIKAGLIELAERFDNANVKMFSPQECVALGLPITYPTN